MVPTGPGVGMEWRASAPMVGGWGASTTIKRYYHCGKCYGTEVLALMLMGRNSKSRHCQSGVPARTSLRKRLSAENKRISRTELYRKKGHLWGPKVKVKMGGSANWDN